jgi:chromate reductase
MRVLGISGSLRRGSHNTELLRVAGAMLPPTAEFEVFDGLADIPPYNADEDGPLTPLPVRRFRDALAGADAVLIATPEYNSSIPGHLKNALDWASRPFPDNCLRNKPVAAVGASTGSFGAVWAQAEVRKVLGAIGARVVDRELAVPGADTAFDDEGRLVSDPKRDALREVVAELVAAARLREAVAA